MYYVFVNKNGLERLLLTTYFPNRARLVGQLLSIVVSGLVMKEPASKKSNTKSSSKGRKHKHRVHKEPSEAQAFDSQLDRWPYCLVWTPLPVVSWFIPIIGHTGIANSKGIIYDFSDDYNVSVDNFSFGAPTKYYQFQPSDVPHGAAAWDKAIQETSDYYSRTRHSLFFNNCHQYIAGVLNKVKYCNRTDWDQYEVWRLATFDSSYTSFIGFLRQWWPFTVILMIVILLIGLIL